MVSRAELPGIGQINGEDLVGPHAGGDKSAGQRFHDLSVFGIGDTAIAGGIKEGGFLGKAAAGFENKVVHKAALRIGVEAGAEHYGSDCRAYVDVVMLRSKADSSRDQSGSE